MLLRTYNTLARVATRQLPPWPRVCDRFPRPLHRGLRIGDQPLGTGETGVGRAQTRVGVRDQPPYVLAGVTGRMF